MAHRLRALLGGARLAAVCAAAELGGRAVHVPATSFISVLSSSSEAFLPKLRGWSSTSFVCVISKNIALASKTALAR